MNEQSDKSRNKNVREAEKQIVRSAFLALAALAVIVFACYAWFVSSGTVTGKVGAVRIDGSSFELASKGEASDHNDLFIENLPDIGDDWIENGESIGTMTGEKSNILWRVDSENSHLENYDEISGISPGSKGKLEFYIIPKRAGELNLKIVVSLIPLNDERKQIFMSDNPTLNQLLRGHLLCSCSCDAVTDYKDILYNYETGDFPIMTISNAEIDHPYPVTLEWLWPEFLRDVIDNDSIGPTIRQWMDESPSSFFYNDGADVGTPSFSTQTSEFRKYNSFYNNADEYIGINVYGIIFKLTVEEI